VDISKETLEALSVSRFTDGLERRVTSELLQAWLRIAELENILAVIDNATRERDWPRALDMCLQARALTQPKE